MLKLAILSACALVLVTGCRTGPPPEPVEWHIATLPQPAPDLPPPSLPAPAPPSLPAPVTNPPTPAAPELTWVSLNRWAAQRGLAEPRRLSPPPGETYALTTANGVWIFQVGSLVASWDRLEIRLGFPPQVIGNQLFIHTLDVKKNLEPLAQASSIATGTTRVIVIDPGHGGLDPGTRSAAMGRSEKEFTLDWAKRLAPLLEQKGWRVFLTRTSDVDVPLPDRTAFADAHHADLFLSLHFNASGGGGEQSGLETYCLTPTGMPSSLTRGYNDDTRQAFPNNTFDAENLQYAVRLQRALLELDGTTDRGVRRARFPAVLRGQNRPAVLIEGGYLSNPREAKRIADPEYRQKLAAAVAKALE